MNKQCRIINFVESIEPDTDGDVATSATHTYSDQITVWHGAWRGLVDRLIVGAVVKGA